MGKNILVVEDSPIMREVVKTTLVKEGFNVLTAENGKEAIDITQSTNDIIFFLVDVTIPIMDGISFVKEMRKIEHYKNVPAIMITTEDMEHRKAEGKEAGANGWIVKPFKPDELVKVINKLIS